MALALRAVALAGAVELAFTLLVAVAVAVVLQGIKTSDFLQGIKNLTGYKYCGLRLKA